MIWGAIGQMLECRQRAMDQTAMGQALSVLCRQIISTRRMWYRVDRHDNRMRRAPDGKGAPPWRR